MTLIYAYKGRNLTRDLTIQDADGATITPGVNDLVRVTIGRSSEIAFSEGTVTGSKFTVTSGTPTANGSSLTAGSANRLRIDASDLQFDAGVYTLFFDYFDNADAREWKNVSRQCFVLEDS